MLLELLLFFAAALVLTSAAAMLRGAIAARLWLSLPLGALALAGAGWFVAFVSQDRLAGEVLGAASLGLAVATRLLLRRWSFLAAQFLAIAVLAALAYLAYAAYASYAVGAGALTLAGSTLLLLLEIAALALSISYLFEILDRLGRREPPLHRPLPDPAPWVAIQVPTYNEPVEVVGQALRSLARLTYPRLIVQVVDNNTKDPATWRPLEALCAQLGPRFQFMHLEDWPGYKAGALNEATRRLPPEVEVLGIVDADYLVSPGWLIATTGHFADPAVAFVQTPQDYRDWEDDGYLRGLYLSYRYFFEVSMPARAHRNAIIFAGTMGLIRRSALEEIGGWNAEVVTEDAEASLRMLGLGYRGVYDPVPYGRGMMPLSFDGLKKQRFRWALGGVQILRRHWRELLPFGPHRLRLSPAQRIHYLLGSLQWFGDVLMVVFTLLLLLTAFGIALHHRLPVRQLGGAALAIPLVFLLTGLARAVWAMRATTGCGWGDSIRALRIWFALSWVVALACLRGAVRDRMAFLRTPKRKEDGPSRLAALWAARGETLLGAAALAGTVVMLVRAPGWPAAALGVLLLFQGAVYASATWASFAAEGIPLTPQRRLYRRSPQSTGDWPQASRAPLLVSLVAAAAVGLLLVYPLTVAGPAAPPFTGPGGPAIGRLQAPQPAAPPAATPSPGATPSPSPSPRATATPSPAPIPSPSRPPVTPAPR